MAKTGKHVVSLDSSARVIFTALMFVKLPPSIAGSVPVRLAALIFVKLLPSIAGSVPVRLAAGISPEPVILLPLRSKSPPS